MNKYYELNKDLDTCTIIVSSLGYEKFYHELKRLRKFYEDKIKDLQKKAELGDHYKHLYSEVKKQKDDVVLCCKNSIKSINEKLKNNKEHLVVIDEKIMYLNDYQVARLKAIRMKCKELLRMLGEIE